MRFFEEKIYQRLERIAFFVPFYLSIDEDYKEHVFPVDDNPVLKIVSNVDYTDQYHDYDKAHMNTKNTMPFFDIFYEDISRIRDIAREYSNKTQENPKHRYLKLNTEIYNESSAFTLDEKKLLIYCVFLYRKLDNFFKFNFKKKDNENSINLKLTKYYSDISRIQEETNNFFPDKYKAKDYYEFWKRFEKAYLLYTSAVEISKLRVQCKKTQKKDCVDVQEGESTTYMQLIDFYALRNDQRLDYFLKRLDINYSDSKILNRFLQSNIDVLWKFCIQKITMDYSALKSESDIKKRIPDSYLIHPEDSLVLSIYKAAHIRVLRDFLTKIDNEFTSIEFKDWTKDDYTDENSDKGKKKHKWVHQDFLEKCVSKLIEKYKEKYGEEYEEKYEKLTNKEKAKEIYKDNEKIWKNMKNGKGKKKKGVGLRTIENRLNENYDPHKAEKEQKERPRISKLYGKSLLEKVNNLFPESKDVKKLDELKMIVNADLPNTQYLFEHPDIKPNDEKKWKEFLQLLPEYLPIELRERREREFHPNPFQSTPLTQKK